MDDEKTDKEEDKEDSETEVTEEEEEKIFDDDWEPVETSYEENTSEELGQVSKPGHNNWVRLVNQVKIKCYNINCKSNFYNLNQIMGLFFRVYL